MEIDIILSGKELANIFPEKITGIINQGFYLIGRVRPTQTNQVTLSMIQQQEQFMLILAGGYAPNNTVIIVYSKEQKYGWARASSTMSYFNDLVWDSTTKILSGNLNLDREYGYFVYV